MCGISGFIDHKKNSDLDVLQRMNASLHHRGPDANGLKLFQEQKATVGLAHARLSIIDLTVTGAQPMQCDHCWIVYNGEVYNFKGTSDTEVILIAYKHWGIDFIQKLVGMFSIVIYDEAKKEAIGVRDRTGIK